MIIENDIAIQHILFYFYTECVERLVSHIGKMYRCAFAFSTNRNSCDVSLTDYDNEEILTAIYNWF